MFGDILLISKSKFAHKKTTHICCDSGSNHLRNFPLKKLEKPCITKGQTLPVNLQGPDFPTSLSVLLVDPWLDTCLGTEALRRSAKFLPDTWAHPQEHLLGKPTVFHLLWSSIEQDKMPAPMNRQKRYQLRPLLHVTTSFTSCPLNNLAKPQLYGKHSPQLIAKGGQPKETSISFTWQSFLPEKFKCSVWLERYFKMIQLNSLLPSHTHCLTCDVFHVCGTQLLSDPGFDKSRTRRAHVLRCERKFDSLPVAYSKTAEQLNQQCLLWIYLIYLAKERTGYRFHTKSEIDVNFMCPKMDFAWPSHPPNQ